MKNNLVLWSRKAEALIIATAPLWGENMLSVVVQNQNPGQVPLIACRN